MQTINSGDRFSKAFYATQTCSIIVNTHTQLGSIIRFLSHTLWC